MEHNDKSESEGGAPDAEGGDQPGSSHVSLRRDLSVFDITMIGVGAMIGAGIFVLTGEAAGVAGPALILAFALNGIVTIFTAMVYAELGSAIPEAGGGYLWIKEGLPGANAFLSGWMSWFAHAVAGALYCLGFGAFLYEILHMLAIPLAEAGISFSIGQKALGIGIAVAFAYINFRGSSETGKAGNIVTVAKMIAVLLFCVFGIKFMFFPDVLFSVGGVHDPVGLERLIPFISKETGWAGIVSAMGLTFIAFEGYEIIVQAGEEVKEPRKNIPRAIFWSLAIVIPVYMLVGFVLIGGTNSLVLIDALHATGKEIPETLSSASANWKILGHLGELGLAQAAAQFIPYGALLILFGGVVSTMSALNATTFSSTRVSFAMGRDRNLPDAFAQIHPTRRTPYKALLWTAVLIVSMVALVPLTTVAAAADIMFLLLFMQVNVAAITLRKKYGDKLAYGYLMPFFPVVPIVGIITELGLAVFMFKHFPVAWLVVLGWLLVGFVIYRFYARKREREKDEPPIIAHERTLTPRPHAVLIPVADSDTDSVRQQIELGARIAKARGSELILLHVETIPRQLPARAASRFVQAARPLLDEYRTFAESLDVPVTTMQRLSHDVAHAITYTVEETKSDFLLMGWHNVRKSAGTLLGGYIDPVIKASNCHAIVMQRGRLQSEERILVPVANVKSAALALAMAAQLHGDANRKITILNLSPRTLNEEEQAAFRNTLLEQTEEREKEPEALFTDPDLWDIRFEVSREPFAEIVRRSGDYDRLILGTSRPGFFRRKVFGRLPRRIAESARCPVIFVRPRTSGVLFGLQGFFQFFRDLRKSGAPPGP